eukprot:7550719-Pyramimonas_sp.AAC.1
MDDDGSIPSSGSVNTGFGYTAGPRLTPCTSSPFRQKDAVNGSDASYKFCGLGSVLEGSNTSPARSFNSSTSLSSAGPWS